MFLCDQIEKVNLSQVHSFIKNLTTPMQNTFFGVQFAYATMMGKLLYNLRNKKKGVFFKDTSRIATLRLN